MKTANQEVRLFGIRHHGAGSARNLMAALDFFDPQAILIEGPHDCQHLIQHVAGQNLSPPVAMMVYSNSDHAKYAYYPFTSFSPEWHAMHWGNERKKIIRFIDLPHGRMLSLREKKVKENNGTGLVADPFQYLAEIAGYTDAEAWWDDYIEQQHDPHTVFEVVSDLMVQLRKSSTFEHQTNHIREAHMRSELRKALKEGHERVAVVCGAWHVPALKHLANYSSTKDDKQWKSSRMERTSASWVPWSYGRIAKHSGYGAGVVSPFWYEALFEDPDKAVARWMSRAAKETRHLGWQSSSADAIEAGRLVHALTAIRKKNRPGISELFDAMATVFCHGDDELLERLRKRLLEGEKVGSVDPSVSMVPLQRDIEKQIKACRLSKAWESSHPVDRQLDIRKASHLRISQLLHRLTLLGIPWGVEMPLEHHSYGQFHEAWSLKWFPDFQIQIIEASLYGNTIEEASFGFVTHHLEQSNPPLDQTAALLLRVLKADLRKLIMPLCESLSRHLATQQDVQLLLALAPMLVNATRYGTTRKMDTAGIREVLAQLMPRITFALPGEVKNISDEVAQSLYPDMAKLDEALKRGGDPIFNDGWVQAMLTIMESNEVHGLMKGAILRSLFDRREYSHALTASSLQYELSRKGDPMYALQFIESFLKDGGSILIHHGPLRKALDSWVTSLTEDYFMDYLVLLRRTFSHLSQSEKENLFLLLNRAEIRQEEAPAEALATERKQLLQGALVRLLGEIDEMK
ncbi:MAG: hypothetical protein KTR24_12520 [Saprospiraceae bacterium]|nr:hypothetical protein [Saprospiraceae bacterium]